MITERTFPIVQELAEFAGIDGCALVDIDSGMVIYHAGIFPGVERIAEAAIEFWRIQTRLSSHFETLGSLNSAAYTFANRAITLFPCSVRPPLVLVSITRKKGVSWRDWGVLLTQLRQDLETANVAAR